MATRWTLEELTELDLRMQRSISADPQDQQPLSEPKGSKQAVLKQWLNQQRQSDPEASKLAKTISLSLSWLSFSLGAFSFVAGCSAAAALLRNPDSRLMNASNYFGVLVGLQVLSLLLLLISGILFRKRLSGLQKLLVPKQIKNLPSPLSLPVWSSRIFFSLQLSGIAFNVGVLMMTLGKGITHDLAFGWATTLQTTGERVHQIVETLALPWGGGYTPTLDQILFSRIYTGTPAALSHPSATAAWWPFLMLCVLFYGLLPRIFLSIWGALHLNRQLKNPNLDSPESERLYLQLTRKSFAFSGQPSEAASHKQHQKLPATFKPENPLRLQVDAQILPPAHQQTFTDRLKSTFEIDLDPRADGILKVVELWQPPLEETLRELRTLRAEMSADADILLLGVGLPSPQQSPPFQPPEKSDLDVWQKRLGELNDPHLGILPWRTP
ncbi:DUF2868 domain-containing protein [Kiritimatiellaeota bacterium B1221]|nr:DUF2868 domain-containing protein [Kiritimatiellaeota bacterium B1221]